METLSESGTVALPEDAMQAVGLHPGSRVRLSVENGRIILQPFEEDDLDSLAGSLPALRGAVEELSLERSQHRW